MLLSDTFDLEELNDDTWQDYYTAMYAMFDLAECPAWYCETNEEFQMLGSFFDIYENEEKNKRTQSLVVETTTIAEMEILQILKVLMPYTSCIETDSDAVSVCADTSTFSVNDAVTYAINYAENPNSAYYGYFSGADCTNFASQIMCAGGVAQEVSTDANTGWWFSFRVYSNGEVTRLYSYTWTLAANFGSYMGIDYYTPDHDVFLSILRVGDFIAYDKDLDGDMEHFGFVTAIDTSGSVKRYQVAQHTTNYLGWSDGTASGWTTLEDKGYRYGIVRC